MSFNAATRASVPRKLPFNRVDPGVGQGAQLNPSADALRARSKVAQELKKRWASFPRRTRSIASDLGQDGAGESRRLELLTCLEDSSVMSKFKVGSCGVFGADMTGFLAFEPPLRRRRKPPTPSKLSAPTCHLHRGKKLRPQLTEKDLGSAKGEAEPADGRQPRRHWKHWPQRPPTPSRALRGAREKSASK